MSLKSGVGEGGGETKGRWGAHPLMSIGRKPHVHNGPGSDHPRWFQSILEADRDLEPVAWLGQPPRDLWGWLENCLIPCYIVSADFFFFLPSTTKISIGLLAGCCGQLSHSWRKWSPLRDWWTLTRPESTELHKYTTPASPPQGCHPHSSAISSIQVSLLVLNVES